MKLIVKATEHKKGKTLSRFLIEFFIHWMMLASPPFRWWWKRPICLFNCPYKFPLVDWWSRGMVNFFHLQKILCVLEFFFHFLFHFFFETTPECGGCKVRNSTGCQNNKITFSPLVLYTLYLHMLLSLSLSTSVGVKCGRRTLFFPFCYICWLRKVPVAHRLIWDLRQKSTIFWGLR